jgi:hypothetical protein
MAVKAKVRIGGLMRCCLDTLDSAMDAATEAPKEGDMLVCKYHHRDGNQMIFHDGAWEWIGVQASRTPATSE